MFFNSRGVALILALVVAIVTTAFLTLVPNVQQQSLLVAGLLSFAATYILVYVVFEFLVIKEIGEIYKLLNKVRKKDFSFVKTEEETKEGLMANPLRDINKEIYDFAINRNKEIEDLKKLEAFRREFLADISHELKTPVFAAQGFVHTLLDGAVEDKRVRGKFLKRAAKSLDKLDYLIQDLLTLSQLETGESKMHLEHFDLVDLTSEVMDQMENKAEKKGLTLQFDRLYQEPISVFADADRIYRVLTNLISNAIKYTDEGQVDVGFTLGDHSVQVSIRDTGSGIPGDQLSRIFERFFRVEKSRSKEKGGTGLGLAIVKHILEAHHATIHVSSTLKKGSVFSFKLPISKEQIGEEDMEMLDEEIEV